MLDNTLDRSAFYVCVKPISYTPAMCMQAVPFAELLQALASGAEGPDIIAAASNMLRKNISSLARMLTAGAVTAEVGLL
jgi:uncharacterized protein (DUF2336 family)